MTCWGTGRQRDRLAVLQLEHGDLVAVARRRRSERWASGWNGGRSTRQLLVGVGHRPDPGRDRDDHRRSPAGPRRRPRARGGRARSADAQCIEAIGAIRRRHPHRSAPDASRADAGHRHSDVALGGRGDRGCDRSASACSCPGRPTPRAGSSRPGGSRTSATRRRRCPTTSPTSSPRCRRSSAAAAATTTLRIGALVFDNDYKHPVVLAKELATHGRAQRRPGRDRPRRRVDGERLPGRRASPTTGPACASTASTRRSPSSRGRWPTAPFSFAGEHYTITDYDGQPKPVQRPHPPLLIGGGGRRRAVDRRPRGRHRRHQRQPGRRA